MSYQPTAPEQGPKRSVGNWFRGLRPIGKFRVVLVAVALLVAPFAIYLGLDEPSQASVGECMTGQSATDLRTVECTDPAATWRVLDRLNGKTESDYDEAACGAHPDTAASFYQDGRRFRKGFILCLGAVNQ